MEDFITKTLLEELGFTLVKYEESKWNKGVFYGEAHSMIPRGMTTINWCTDGHSCTYFGRFLKPNISVHIKKDGGTRTVFSGYCFTVNDFKRILKLTW